MDRPAAGSPPRGVEAAVRCGALILILVGGRERAIAQGAASRDSTLTVRGVLEMVEDSGDRPVGAILVLEQQLVLPGGAANALTLGGDLRRLEASDSHFVQVTGTLGPPQAVDVGRPALPTLLVSRLRDAEPAGLVRRTLSQSMNEWVVEALAVVPNRVTWRDSAGRATGVSPAALFTIANFGRVPVQQQLQSSDLVCVTVKPRELSSPQGSAAPAWSYAWKATDASTTIMIKIGATFRSMIPLPETAAGAPGRYTVRVTLCGLDEYALEAPLQVGGN